MKLLVEDGGIQIITETAQDKAYFEHMGFTDPQRVLVRYHAWQTEVDTEDMTASHEEEGLFLLPNKPKASELELKCCLGCGTDIGQPHKEDCYVEKCSVCGGQWLKCKCEGHDRLFARWTGILPGKAEASYLRIDLNDFERQGYNKTFFVKPKAQNATK